MFGVWDAILLLLWDMQKRCLLYVFYAPEIQSCYLSAKLCWFWLLIYIQYHASKCVSRWKWLLQALDERQLLKSILFTV